jgi:hypothetical protein
MVFSSYLQSMDAAVIRSTLLSLLNSVTEREVLQVDHSFYTLSNQQAKIEFLFNLESASPVLLERWTHYCWLRLELSYLANQRASLNQIAAAQRHAHPDFPLIHSIHNAIKEDAVAGTSIEKSIATLRKINLQIVGTEHPTDPLSQSARDTLTKIANEIEAKQPNEANVCALLKLLQETDPIPPFRRDVEEEVNRNINMVLDKLYDSLPAFVESVLQSYQKSYGNSLFEQHKEAILQALEGGLQPTGEMTKPIMCDASWAGCDADGNQNVTPDTMRYVIRLHRIRAAEKHIASLEINLIAACKEVERKLRDEIFSLNQDLFKELAQSGGDFIVLFRTFNRFQIGAASYLTSRSYDALVANFEQQQEYTNTLQMPPVILANIKTIFAKQYDNAILLKKVTRFSGTYRTIDIAPDGKMTQGKLEQGDLQKLQQLFQQFKAKIRENTDDIKIKNGSPGKTFTQTQYAIAQYQKIISDHSHIFTFFPNLQLPMRCFGIQLNCFGMTYGMCHLRQDSSIFIKVWDLLLNDFCQDPPSIHFPLFINLKTKGYLGLNEEERIHLHQYLQAIEGRPILETINRKHKASMYRRDPKFKWAFRELERVDLALRHEDMFENIIISNCESASNILEVESLLDIFSTRQRKITVVPLLEKRQDLENHERILTPSLQDKRERNIPLAETMFGFSDTERVSGLSALLSVQQVQEDFIKLAARHGLQAKLYHGPGGDPNRGGLKRRDEKATLQGNARSNMLTTGQSTARFRETQFYEAYANKAHPLRHMEFSQLPPAIGQDLQKCKEEGAAFYENLHDTQNGLGKLLGFMLGQGAHWMVELLNSSSRASQRDAADSHGDRTISVQTGGIRPPSYIDPDKPRAITATQIKELLRDNIHLLMGSGWGLRAIGKEAAERLYDSSLTIRDMVEKITLGLARTDFSITSLALFDDKSEWLPKNSQQRKLWADECRAHYPNFLKEANVDELAKTNRPLLMKMLSRLFAYIVEESIQTRDFIFSLNQRVHFEQYHATAAPKKLEKATDILYHYPEWRQQEELTTRDAEPLYLLFARQNYQVAQGRNLDNVYRGLNEAVSPYNNSRLSGVGRLLGNVGAGLTCARILPPAFYEKIHLDYSPNLRTGVARADREKIKMYGPAGKAMDFPEKKLSLETFFAMKKRKAKL